MTKQNKKSKGKGTKVEAAAAGADDDFDDMLAELRAADVTTEAATSVNRSTSSSKSSSSTSTTSSSTTNRASAAMAQEVSEEALMRACVRGDVSQLRRWARSGIRVTSAEPLCDAVWHNNYEVVLCLVRELGADVNQIDENGLLPLCSAARVGDLRMIKCLVIELGADVNRFDAAGNTPLFVAAAIGNLAVVRYLVKELDAEVNRAHNGGMSPLYIVAQQGRLDIVQCLVEELGANVNIKMEDGSTTPLMIAAMFMNHKIVRYLLKHGADPQIKCYGRIVTAADFSDYVGAPAEETAYLEARTHCANPGCTNAGLKKCERCLQAYFCGNACIRAHWPAHKAECTAAAVKLKAARGTSSTSPSMPSSP
jgi:hypothetical protein